MASKMMYDRYKVCPKPLAMIGETAWSRILIESVTDEEVVIRYAYVAYVESGDNEICTRRMTRQLQYGVPEWSEEEELYFVYRGWKYWLSECLRLDEMKKGA